MTDAVDETTEIPAADAIAEVAASQPDLPIPFNYEGAYLELERIAVEVDRCKREYETKAEHARDAKKRWEKEAKLYTSMALELRATRRAKLDPPEEEDGDLFTDGTEDEPIEGDTE